MAEEKQDGAPPAGDQAPVFRMQKMYVKDLSFENPNAPEVFTVRQGDPKVEVNLGLKTRRLPTDDLYEVAITVNAKINQADGKTLFILEIEHCGAFLIKNIPQEHMPTILNVECPTLLFPFTRQIISQVSVDGGFIPFLMDPVNFMALFQNAQRQAAGRTTQ